MRIFIISLSFVLFVTHAMANAATGEEDENSIQVKKSLLAVQQQIKKLEKKAYQRHGQEKTLAQQLSAIEKDMGERSDRLRELQEKMRQQTELLQTLQQESAQIKQATSLQQYSLTQLIQATYEHYQKEKLRLLFEQTDWSASSRLNQYYQYFYAARADQLEQLMNNLQKIQTLQHQINHEQELLQELTHKVKSEQSELEKMKQDRTMILKKLTQEIHMTEEELSQLQKQEQHLEQLFKSLEKKLSTTPTYIEPAQDFVQLKGKLSLPVQEAGAKLTTLTNQNNAGKKSYIRANAGTPVLAIAPGRVVFAEWLRGLGLLVIIDHGQGYMSLYGNNQKLYKGLGDWVNQGEMISRVGQSGGQAEPGLYFEIRKNGEAIDSAPWISKG